MGRKPRGKRSSRAKEQPAAIVQEGQIKISGWMLASPEIVYHADTAEFDLVGGVPTLYFAQVAPGGGLLNAVGLSMPPGSLEDWLPTFNPIFERLRERLDRTFEGVTLPEVNFGDVTNDNFRKLPVSITRAACSDERAMIDFYHVEVATKERLDALQSNRVEELIFPTLRVTMTPLVLAHLFERIEEETGHEIAL